MHQNNLIVCHFGRHVEGLDAKHDATAHDKRKHHQMQNGRGCSNRTPRDSKRRISFNRLPLKIKPFLKEWLVRIKDFRAKIFQH